MNIPKWKHETKFSDKLDTMSFPLSKFQTKLRKLKKLNLNSVAKNVFPLEIWPSTVIMPGLDRSKSFLL